MGTDNAHENIGWSFGSGRWWRLLGVLLCVRIGAPVCAQESPPQEFQVKAVFLFNFAQFVEWPPEAFERPDSPLVIGVLGPDPFGDFLDEIVRAEKIRGRALVVERYRWVGEVGRCHILFVSGSEGGRAEQIAEAMHGRCILTVCDWEGLARRGAMVQFVTEHKRVRLRINLDAARAAKLTISSKLLRSAEAVTRGGDW